MVGILFFSTIKQPSSFKQKLADGYILFLISVLNYETIPNRFLLFTLSLGVLIGRRIVWVWSIPYPKWVLVMALAPGMTLLLSLILVFGYLILSLKYPKVFGKILISFLKKHAAEELLHTVGLKKSRSSSKNKKN